MPPSEIASTSGSLDEIAFSRALRGYDPHEVDDAVARLREEVEALTRRRGELEQEADELRTEVARLGPEQDVVRDLLVVARRTVAEIERTAREDADRRLAEAQTVLEEAEGRAASILSDAQTRAGELERLAAEKADRVVSQAVGQASERAEAAREEARACESELARLKGLEREMKAGYRAFLVAALELLDRSDHAEAEDADAGPGPDGGAKAVEAPLEAA